MFSSHHFTPFLGDCVLTRSTLFFCCPLLSKMLDNYVPYHWKPVTLQKEEQQAYKTAFQRYFLWNLQYRYVGKLWILQKHQRHGHHSTNEKRQHEDQAVEFILESRINTKLGRKVQFSSFHFRIPQHTNAIKIITTYFIKATNYNKEIQTNKITNLYNNLYAGNFLKEELSQ